LDHVGEWNAPEWRTKVHQTLSTTDTKNRWERRKEDVSVVVKHDAGTGKGVKKNGARRTFGGMPLITGINRIYKNKAIVKRPDRAETPTNGLTIRFG
jgi:hypothetical protein